MRDNTIQSIIYTWEREAKIQRPRSPALPHKDEQLRRLEFIKEEVRELQAGFAAEDIVEVADALGDILWFVYGTAHACGINLDAVVKEIAGSNYTKLPAQRNSFGKVQKGPDYVAPDIARVLELQAPLTEGTDA